MVLMPGFQSTRLATEGALEPFLFLYTDDSIQGNPETCNQSSMMLNYEVKNMAEGSVNKIKVIKRIMYGRSSFDLLKAKVLFHELFHVEIN